MFMYKQHKQSLNNIQLQKIFTLTNHSVFFVCYYFKLAVTLCTTTSFQQQNDLLFIALHNY